MRNTERDESVERMLRKTLQAASASGAAPGACLDGETLAAWTEDALPPARAALVEAHLADCPRCQALIATFARTAPAPVGESFWQRWRLRWLVPIAAAATAVAIWIAVPPDRPPAALQESDVRVNANAPVERVAPAEPIAPAEPVQPEQVQSVAPVSPPTPSAEPPTSANAPAVRQDAAREAEARASVDALRPAAQDADAAARSGVGDELGSRASGAAAQPPASAPPAQRRELASLGQTQAPLEIISPDPASRWRILAGAQVERSTTTGATWEALSIGAAGELTAGSSPDRTVCWLVGRAGTIRLTVDGVRFTSVPFPETVDLVSVRASSASSALVTTADGRQFRTDDRGQTWSRVIP